MTEFSDSSGDDEGGNRSSSPSSELTLRDDSASSIACSTESDSDGMTDEVRAAFLVVVVADLETDCSNLAEPDSSWSPPPSSSHDRGPGLGQRIDRFVVDRRRFSHSPPLTSTLSIWTQHRLSQPFRSPYASKQLDLDAEARSFREYLARCASQVKPTC